MFASLLPGVRELRGPISAGFVWMLSAWLLFAGEVPVRQDATGIYESLYRLSDGVSAVGTGVALGFVAYVVGIVLQRLKLHRLLLAPFSVLAVTSSAWKRLSLVARSMLTLDSRTREALMEQRMRLYNGQRFLDGLTDRVAAALVDVVTDAVVSTTGGTDRKLKQQRVRELLTVSTRDLGSEAELELRTLAGEVIESIPLVELRLRAESTAYGGEVDRARAEGEFRTSLVDPTMTLVLSIVVAANAVWAIVGLAIPLVLFLDGRAKAEEATVGVLAAIRSDALNPVPSAVTLLRQRAGDAWNEALQVTMRE